VRSFSAINCDCKYGCLCPLASVVYIYSFIAICRAHYLKNVESEALQAVARWWVIGKIVSFKLRLKLLSEGDCLTESGVSFQILGAQ